MIRQQQFFFTHDLPPHLLFLLEEDEDLEEDADLEADLDTDGSGSSSSSSSEGSGSNSVTGSSSADSDGTDSTISSDSATVVLFAVELFAHTHWHWHGQHAIFFEEDAFDVVFFVVAFDVALFLEVTEAAGTFVDEALVDDMTVGVLETADFDAAFDVTFVDDATLEGAFDEAALDEAAFVDVTRLAARLVAREVTLVVAGIVGRPALVNLEALRTLLALVLLRRLPADWLGSISSSISVSGSPYSSEGTAEDEAAWDLVPDLDFALVLDFEADLIDGFVDDARTEDLDLATLIQGCW